MKKNVKDAHVLIVDDYESMLTIISNLLKQLGFEHVDQANSGKVALKMMKCDKYDLVISDWNMEPVTGLELLKDVRANKNLQNTPFLIITPESKEENVNAAEKAGVTACIIKPFDASSLKGKLTKVLGEF